MSKHPIAGRDLAGWAGIFSLILLAIGANIYFSAYPLSVRLALGLLLLLVLLFLATKTSQGQLALVFIREARIELRKVIWPTRQQTVQTTLVVMLVVLLASLLLRGMDAFLMWVISWVTGQRG